MAEKLTHIKPLEISLESNYGVIPEDQWNKLLLRMKAFVNQNFQEKRAWPNFWLGKGRKPKSKVQRGYYWGVIVPFLMNELSWSRDQVHDEHGKRFLMATRTYNGVTKDVVMSTEELDSAETEIYYEEIRQYWLTKYENHPIVIPLPNEDLSWLNE
jgi:hypothetical protein